VGSLITFDLFEFTAADCAVPSFYVRWLLTVCVPLFFLSPLLIMVFFHSPLLYGKVESGKDLHRAKTNKRGDELFQTIAIIIVFLYALMVGKSISPFECTIGPDGRWYLREDPSIRCWESDQWHSMACIVGLVLLWTYGLYLPFKLRKAVYKLGELKFMPSSRNFEFVLLGQKLALVMFQKMAYVRSLLAMTTTLSPRRLLLFYILAHSLLICLLFPLPLARSATCCCKTTGTPPWRRSSPCRSA
jgi:hypothetical protein